MIISDVGCEPAEHVARVSARVAWEDCDRPAIELYFDTEEDFLPWLAADTSALLGACVLPAWGAGEKRVRIEGKVCALLQERIKAPIGMLNRWYPNDLSDVPVIEATAGFEVREPVHGPSLALLSCGIDSLATLRWNTLTIPRWHRLAIQASLFIAHESDYDLPELGGLDAAQRLDLATSPRRDAVTAVASDGGTTPVPVMTNLLRLEPDGWFFTKKWHGAFLAGIVSLFSGRFSRGYIASSHDPLVVEPYGSHPLLDPYFSTAHFEVEHDLFSMSRSDKLSLVSNWPIGAANIRVCTNDPNGGPNCGTCEKCIRTQVQFASIGRAEAAKASFPNSRLSPGLVQSIEEYDMIRGHPYYVAWYTAAIPGLRRHGLDDVADSLTAVVKAATS